MMMMGEMAYHTPPPWAVFDEAADGLGYGLPVSGVSGGSAAADCSPYLLGEATLAALQRYLPSNDAYLDSDDGDLDAPVDAYSCDEFRMYEFKIRRCARGRSHDWTECPYAHLGEKARRRDPRKYHYSGVACPDFRKGSCRRGDACEFAHGVFECWLHPSRYRTQPCKDGTACRRRVCFFAHTPEQLRVLQQQTPRCGSAAMDSYDGSPLRRQAALEDFLPKSLKSTSPTSTLVTPPVSPPSESPPVSPSGGALRRASWPVAGSGMNEVLASLRQLQLTKAKSMPVVSWGVGGGGGLFGSPREARIGSLPATPMRLGAGWMEGGYGDGEPEVRVESGRALRAKMFERLSKEAEKPSTAAAGGGASAPDLGWVSESQPSPPASAELQVQSLELLHLPLVE